MNTLALINAIKFGKVNSHLEDLIQLASKNKDITLFPKGLKYL